MSSTMNRGKILLLNSPKSGGKDVAAQYLSDRISQEVVYAECKGLLYTLVQDLFSITEARFWEIYNDRDLKEIPLPEFKIRLFMDDMISLNNSLKGGIPEDMDVIVLDDGSVEIMLSIRWAMIYVSEVICKPRFGKEFFGKARVARMQERFADLYIDPSAAFIEELTPLIEYIGQENILLLRIHREGYTFEGDSRDYIPDGIIDNTLDIYNNGTLEDYLDKVLQITEDFLND